LPAADAPAFQHDNLAVVRPALGVVTPGALQRAAFQEDSRPNPRPIVHRVFLDAEDQAVLHHATISRSGSLAETFQNSHRWTQMDTDSQGQALHHRRFARQHVSSGEYRP
jgi:hypothetical protein